MRSHGQRLGDTTCALFRSVAGRDRHLSGYRPSTSCSP